MLSVFLEKEDLTRMMQTMSMNNSMAVHPPTLGRCGSVNGRRSRLRPAVPAATDVTPPGISHVSEWTGPM